MKRVGRKKDKKMKRCCFTCKHFQVEESVCCEGGFTEVGDPERVLTREDCFSWNPVSKLELLHRAKIQVGAKREVSQQ